MHTYQIDHHINAWKEKEERTEGRIARILAQVSNCLFAAAGGKAEFTPEHFLGNGQQREMTDEELYARARLIFNDAPNPEST